MSGTSLCQRLIILRRSLTTAVRSTIIGKGQDFVDVAFVRGVQLEKRFPQLQNYNNRKQVRSMQYKSLEEIDEQLLCDLIVAAAALTDKGLSTRFD